jgi:hypothetical protein
MKELSVIMTPASMNHPEVIVIDDDATPQAEPVVISTVPSVSCSSVHPGLALVPQSGQPAAPPEVIVIDDDATPQAEPVVISTVPSVSCSSVHPGLALVPQSGQPAAPPEVNVSHPGRPASRSEVVVVGYCTPSATW